jgi:hypothetical protein
LLTLQLLLESQSIKLLLNESRDAILYLLEVFMIIILDLAYLCEYSLLLLRAAELREPFGLSSLLLLLFAEVCLR